MDRIAITGFGVVSAAGIDERSFFGALDEGRSAIAPDAALGVAARVPEFGAKSHIAAGNLRRMPRMAQMAIVAAKQALADARLATTGEAAVDSTRIGVVLGTGLGTLTETLDFMNGYIEGGPEGASPMLFPQSVMNAPAGIMALELQLRGVNTTINHREVSALGALTMASDLLTLNRADFLLVGGVDELARAQELGYRELGRLAKDVMRPYDQNRTGLIAAEASTMFVLEKESKARARGAKCRALLTGRGESGDIRPRVGWGHSAHFERAASSIEAAVASAPGPVDYVAGCGNGTALDAHEIDALTSVFAGKIPPTSSILGQTGELMTSGLLRVASALYVIQRGVMPGTVGLASPIAGAASVLSSPRRANVEHVLVPSFAQGGGNIALVVSRGA